MLEVITLGAGCFWCIEAVFSTAIGVQEIDVGYCNGQTQNPTYEMVCTGNTGHVEAAKISFDSDKITLQHILDLFFKSHDPTTLNKQGADIGTQYRSGIYYINEQQRDIANNTIERWNKSGYYENPIVTEIEPLNKFYIAEDYHQEYYKNNSSAPYCKLVIKPKLDKLGR